jgi:putative FmdB family regulatory protein
MPIYDYRCRRCKEVHEIFIRDSDSGIKCPSCGSEDMERLVSASYRIKLGDASSDNTTCCGRAERCEAPPCSSGGSCHRH